MEEEVSKHTKKIYREFKNPRHSFGEKLKEILIEIFIIVFAVTLSIWLHSWSEHRHEKKEADEFLTDLKSDLNNDIQSMQFSKDMLAKSLDSIALVRTLTKEKLDSMNRKKLPVGFHANIATTNINSGNYEGFKSSGKIGFIEDKELKKDILKYYQDVSPSVLEIEKFSAVQLLKTTDFMAQNSEPESDKTILKPQLKFMLGAYQSFAESNLKSYDTAIVLAKTIIKKIDKKE